MSQHGTARKNRILVPFTIALLASLITVTAFFLPYISSTEDYAKYLASRADEHPFDTVNITLGDMKDLSLFEYTKIYFLGGQEIMQSEFAGIFYGALISSIGILSLLVLLGVIKKKPIMTFFFTALMAGVCYNLNWDFVDRGIMPGSNSLWGVSYYLFYICAAVIALSAIWMFVAKRRMKKEMIITY
jgi:hypothetical protein